MCLCVREREQVCVRECVSSFLVFSCLPLGDLLSVLTHLALELVTHSCHSTHTHTHTHTHTQTHIHTQARMHACTHTCWHTHMLGKTHKKDTHTHTTTQTHTDVGTSVPSQCGGWTPCSLLCQHH